MLGKKLGLSSAIAAGVGLIVATSCLVSLSQGVGIAGKGFIIAMAIACALNILVAFSFAELNALMPITGGLGQYTLASLGPFVSMIAVIGGYLFTNIFTASSEAAMIGFVVTSTVLPNMDPILITLIALTALFVINYFGMKSYAVTQILVTAFMLGSLILLGVIGATQIGSGQVVTQAVTDFNPMGMSVLSLTALAFWLFIGCEFVTPLTKDIKNPEKNIPRGMIISLLLLLVVQSVMVFAISNYVPYDILVTSNQPHMEFARMMLGDFGTNWMLIISVGAVISTLNTVLASVPRMLMGLAESGMLPKVFAKTNKYNVPYISLIVLYGLISIALLSGITSADDLIRFILTGCTFWMIAYIIAHINVLVLRKKYPNRPRTFSVKLGGLPQIIGIAGMVYMIANVIDDPEIKASIYMTTAVLMLVLVVYSAVWVKFVMKKRLFETVSIDDVIAMDRVEDERANWGDDSEESEAIANLGVE
ncbi:APC family permease [Eubacteriaceae bacterium ES3]|nr:APC family permease [Eubacteriaceae bacterium ES3]